MAGGQIPEYEKAVQMRSMPMAVQNFNIDPASVAGMYIQAGRFISKGFDTISEVAAKEQERTDKLAVDSQYAAFAQEADQYMQENVVSQKGTYAPAPETVRANLDLIRQKYASKLDSRKAQDEFFSAAGSRMVSSVTMATAHREKEYNQSLVETNAAIAKDSANNAENLALTVGVDHPQTLENLNKVYSSIHTMGVAQGTPPEAIKLQQGQAKSGIFANIVQAKIATGDITGAQVLFDKENAKATFSPDVRNVLTEKLKNHNDLQNAAVDIGQVKSTLIRGMDSAVEHGAIIEGLNKLNVSEDRKRRAIGLENDRFSDKQRVEAAIRSAKHDRYMSDLGTIRSEEEATVYAMNIPDADVRHNFQVLAKAQFAPLNEAKDAQNTQTIREAIDKGSIEVTGLDGKKTTMLIQGESDIPKIARALGARTNVSAEALKYFKDRNPSQTEVQRIWDASFPPLLDKSSRKKAPPEFYEALKRSIPPGEAATDEKLLKAGGEFFYQKGLKPYSPGIWGSAMGFLRGVDPLSIVTAKGRSSPTTEETTRFKAFESKSTDFFSYSEIQAGRKELMNRYEKANGKPAGSEPPDEAVLKYLKTVKGTP